MLPVVLVLLAATSVLAAPTQVIYQSPINEVAPQRSNGRLVGSYLTDRALEIVDGGNNNAYILTLLQVVNDLANLNNVNEQAKAVATAIAVLTKLSTGLIGDACAEANVIDAYVLAARSGNPKAARGAVANYIQNLASGLDLIVQLAANPNSLKFTTGSRGSCQGGGSFYSFEAAWDLILANAVSPLDNEQYCATKNLNNSFRAISRNVGAASTAASLPPVVKIFRAALQPVAAFLAAIGNGAPAQTAANVAKQALIRASNSY